MIDLTPLEVRKKKGDFRRQLRGYDPGQVDDFLDVVADRLEQLVRENLSSAERLTRLEQQVTEFRDRERAMTEALVTAQQMRDQMKTQVVKEVELAKREAVQDADRIRSDALQEAEREEENLSRLRQRQRQLLHSFRTFLERELSELVVFSKALEFDDSVPDDDAPRGRRSSSRARGTGRAATPPPPRDEEEDEHGGAGAAKATAAGAAALLSGPAIGSARDTPAPPQPTFAPAPALPTAIESVPPPEPRPYYPPAVDAPDDTLVAEPPPAVVAPDNPFLAEPPPAVEDRPEPVEAAHRMAAPEPAETLDDVSEDEFGGLFTEWDDPPLAAPEDMAGLSSFTAEAAVEDPVSDEAFLDELLLAEAELLLSDEDVLEDPLDDRALEVVGGDPDTADFSLEEDLLEEGLLEEGLLEESLTEEGLLDGDLLEEELAGAESVPGDQPVDLGLLSDADEFARLNLDDLGLPPLPKASDSDVFGSAGLTLRPLPADEEAPEVPRERGRDDDEDMFSSLFGKPR